MKRKKRVVCMIILYLLLSIVLWCIFKPTAYVTIERLREINYLFDQDEKGMIELSNRELAKLIKEYGKPIRCKVNFNCIACHRK